MTVSWIAVDGYFVVVLAAWWRLRRSAYLLPHLRRRPSSLVFHPGHGLVAGIMAIITVPAVLSWCGWRLLADRVVVPNGRPETRLLPAAQFPDAQPIARAGSGFRPGPANGACPPGRSQLRPGSIRRPRLASRAVSPPIPEPRRRSWTMRETSDDTSGTLSGGSVDPPTCPVPVIGQPSPGQTTVPIGRPVEPPRGNRGSGYAKSPTQQTASARRGRA